MDKHSVRKLILLFAALLVLLACELPVLIPTCCHKIQPQVPLKQLSFKQQPQRKRRRPSLLPPPTSTPTLTQLPTGTPTETPTPTATFIFILPTSTKPFEPYKAGSQCELIALTPNNPVLAPREIFETNWTLKNTGNELWLDKNIDFKYSGGTDMHKTDVYDLPNSVSA